MAGIIAMMTEEEYDVARNLSKEYGGEPTFGEAVNIVRDYFSDVERLGVIRLREHPQYSRDMNLAEFLSVLAEIFPIL